jgi:hypothetical protein
MTVAGLMLCRALDPRRTALAMGAAVALLAALGYAVDEEGSLRAFAFERLVTVPGLVTGLVLAATGGLVVLAGREGLLRRPAPQWLWVVVAGVAVVAAIDSAGAVHERIDARFDVGWQVTAVPAVALGAAGWLTGAWLLRGTGGPLAIWWGGALVWSLGGALELVAEGEDRLAVERGGLELAGAVLLFVAMVIAIRQGLAARGELGGEVSLWEAAVRFVRELRPGVVAAVIGIAIAFLAGLMLMVQQGFQAYAFDPSAEQTVPAGFSGGLIVCNAALSLMLSRLRPAEAWPWRLMTLAFVLLGADEIGGLHEKLEDPDRSALLDPVLVPLLLFYASAWLLVLRGIWEDRAVARLWIAAALTWIASQGLEVSHAPNPDHPTIVPEEALEMVGSGLFLLALLLAVQSTVPRLGLKSSRPAVP